ncbi:hypothetical protein [Lysobacter gummosus]|uniref:hypothetical protein n=1 Tax=Lysobacter gummosus TaxID=262324 RepID=UPI0036254342
MDLPVGSGEPRAGAGPRAEVRPSWVRHSGLGRNDGFELARHRWGRSRQRAWRAGFETMLCERQTKNDVGEALRLCCGAKLSSGLELFAEAASAFVGGA